MVEVMDKNTGHKMMMMILCGVCYQDDCYLIYCIRRDNDDANIFVSKLIKGSLGYLVSDNFDNGEKEVLDDVVKRLLNRESRETLENSGFSLLKDIDMDNNLTFDIDKCYVCTVSRAVIKDCLVYYEMVNEKIFSQPVIEVVDDERKFNDGFASNIVLIVFGIIVLIFVVVIIIGVLF